MPLARWLLVVAVVAALLVLWCRSRGLSPAQQRRVDAWLECVECNAGELDSAVAIGAKAVPVFSQYLLHGPPQARLVQLRVNLDSSYKRLSGYVQHDSLAPRLVSESSYVGTFVSNYDATYRSRSVRALRRLGGPDATAAIASALALPLRPDVLVLVKCARSPNCVLP